MTSAMTKQESFATSLRIAEGAFDRLGIADQFVIEFAYAKQVAMENYSLYQCDQASVTKALVNIALTGLTLDPVRKLAYLIPRGGKCVLQPSYRGLIHSITATGGITSIEAKVVYAGDLFEFEEGTSQFLRHVPVDLKENPTEEDLQQITAISRNPYAAMRCAYSIATFKNGHRSFVIMPKWRIDKIRDVAKGTDKPTSPWKKWPEEQIRKTVIAYHTKTLDVGGKAAEAVQIYHDNDGIKEISKEVTGGLMAALGINQEVLCGVCNEPLEDGLCHNIKCSDGVPR